MTPVPHPSLHRHTPLYMRIWRARYLYLLLLPGLAYFLIFRYAPMGGLLLAFKKYNGHFRQQMGRFGSLPASFYHAGCIERYKKYVDYQP